MTQAFYRKWRPQTWDDVVGQDHVIQTLRNAVSGGRTGHAYLFAGPRGTGKTSTARLLAKALNCTHEELLSRPCNQCAHCKAIQEGRFLDLIEIDAASNTSVEDVRDLRDKINFSPNQGRYKVYIVDEVHMLSTAAFNALLKTLEEPPPHAVFVLATTEVHKIPATVLSRCQRHEFRRLPPSTMVPYLQSRIEMEHLEVAEEVLPLIARQATGSLRDAISLLDQLASTGEAVTLQMASDVLGTAANEAVIRLVQALAKDDPPEGLNMIQRALDGGTDPRQFCRQVVDHLHNVLLVKMGTPELAMAGEEDLATASSQAGRIPLDVLLDVIRIFQDAAQERHSTRIPSLSLEIAFLEGIQLLHRDVEENSASPGQHVSAAGSSAEPPQPRVVEKKEIGGADFPEAEAKTAPEEENVLGLQQSNPSDSAGREENRQGRPEQTQRVDPDQNSGIRKSPAGGDQAALELLQRDWKRFLGEIRKRDPILQGLVNSSRPLGFEDNALVLGFEADILKEKMLKPDNMERAREALEAVLGREAGVRCVLADEWSGAGGGNTVLKSPAANVPVQAEKTAQDAAGSTSEAKADSGYGENGIVAAAVEQFGARVVDVEDLPDSNLDLED